ncbi:MAG: stealth family protein [Legionellaceae bacterium]|nr:stealth family protein [Legionellaceae bacterium]
MVVDAVITWVDGSDARHIKKRQTYLKSIQKNSLSEDSAAPTRFNSSGEINYCLRSLLHFAPWLRTIYIVTDGQVPPIVTALQGTSYEHRIQIIDHRDIFKDFEKYLPTFNSLSIESMLWRIPGLSEQFIYLNDDCALLRPVELTDFFREGVPVVRGEWKTQHAYKWRQYFPSIFSSKPIAPHRRYQESSAKLAGYTRKFLHLPHVPFPLVKQVFADFFEEHPEIFLKNLNDRVRSPKQFWSISLVYHLGLKDHSFEINNALQAVSVHATHHTWAKIKSRLARARRNPNIAFICIQSLDQAIPDVRDALLEWLDACIPELR